MVFGAPRRKAECSWLSGDKSRRCRLLGVQARRDSQIVSPLLRLVHRVYEELRKLQLSHFRGLRRKLCEGHSYCIQTWYPMRHLLVP
jgi:hypothetical protein